MWARRLRPREKYTMCLKQKGSCCFVGNTPQFISLPSHANSPRDRLRNEFFVSPCGSFRWRARYGKMPNRPSVPDTQSVIILQCGSLPPQGGTRYPYVHCVLRRYLFSSCFGFHDLCQKWIIVSITELPASLLCMRWFPMRKANDDDDDDDKRYELQSAYHLLAPKK